MSKKNESEDVAPEPKLESESEDAAPESKPEPEAPRAAHRSGSVAWRALFVSLIALSAVGYTI